jgi:hypothetical protein
LLTLNIDLLSRSCPEREQDTFLLFNATGTMNQNKRIIHDADLLELAEDYRILESARCRCSAAKGLGEAFCGDCLDQLPEAHRVALRIARPAITFGTTYRAASGFLDQRTKRRFIR